MDIEKNEVTKGVVSLKFTGQYETCSTFMRLQEFYESQFNEIRGKFFTLEKFMDCYAKQEGNFTYTTDWGGFNVPGHIVRNFFKLFKDEALLEKEKRLKKELAEQLNGKSRFYVIGHYGKTNSIDLTQDEAIFSVLAHEVAHGTFYLNPPYRRAALKVVDSLSDKTKDKITAKLTQMGYAKGVIKDEMHAYLATSQPLYLKSLFRVKVEKHSKLLRKLLLEALS